MKKLVQIVIENPSATANEMARMLSKSLSTVEKTIRRLKKDKIIEPRFCSWLQNLPERSDETKFV
ncbi:MAG: winged helix-turn-helix domain-containing protein [Chitinophagaceae bacterium]|nr:MAG: winged helix-turn-helix domain-containing protein [Chitinophagaceae bacterium]